MGTIFDNLLRGPKALPHLVLILVCLSIGLTITSLGFDVLLQRQNQTELQDTTKRIVERTELAIDYAVMTAFEVLEKTEQPCSEAGQSILRKLVHSRSVVKDIRVLGVGGRIMCVAFPNLDAKSETVPLLGKGQAARNSDYTLHSVEIADRKILGVSWQHEKDQALLVAIDLDAQLFDSLPTKIRDISYTTLSLGGQDVFAKHGQDLSAEPAKSAQTMSSRYPISVETKIKSADFAKWNDDNRYFVLSLGGLLGLLLGGFLVRELRRPPSLESELKAALSRNEFVPYYQAKFDLASKAIIGCEILMRWKKADGSVVPPNSFIPLAEATNMIVPMTRAVTRQALIELREYMTVDRGFKLAVNITPGDFMTAGFAEELKQLVEAQGIMPQQIILELTERQGMEDVDALKASIKSAREIGFKVALDDMGTGHNGLSHLQDIGVDIIKIDKKFVDFVGKEPTADAIIDLLVNLAIRLGMTTLAEGIETEAQRQALIKAGVNMGQGYLVGKPLPVEGFTASLLRHLLDKAEAKQQVGVAA